MCPCHQYYHVPPRIIDTGIIFSLTPVSREAMFGLLGIASAGVCKVRIDVLPASFLPTVFNFPASVSLIWHQRIREQLDAFGADGIHSRNGGDVDNIHWSDVGEDAFTVKDPTNGGSVSLRNIEGYKGSDKYLQVNDDVSMTVNNCIVDDMGKFLRQNGGKTFPISVDVSNCQISNMKEGIFRSDSPNSTARITNSRLHNAGDICIGSWRSCSSSGISYY